MRKNLSRGLAVAALLVTAGLTVSGCAMVDELVHHQKSGTFEDRSAFEADSDLDAPWLPSDSSEIRSTRSTQADDATVAVLSKEELSADICAEVPRQSAPAYALEDTVNVYKVSDVFACGAWSVAKTPTGWVGWTPNHPDEKAQSPAS